VARRQHGQGSLFVREDRRGRETWYAKVRVNGRQVKRVLGPKRPVGTREGLTKTQAEARLSALILELETGPPQPVQRHSVAEVGRAYLAHLTTVGRRRSTLMEYESFLRVHLAPFFGQVAIDKIEREQVEAFAAAKLEEGKAPKSVSNYLGLLHSLFEFARKRGWASANPCKEVEQPRKAEADPDVRFLDDVELEELLRSVPTGGLGAVDRLIYLTAAMTGLRQGELLGLRWRDVDWPAGRIRVRRSFVRGEFGQPKSKRSSRSVPMIDRLATELELHFQSSPWQGDDELVFGHPQTGKPLERSRLLKRFKRNLARGGKRAALSRPAPHLRHPRRRPGRAAADAAGMDGPPRLQDHPHLRRLPAQPARSRTGRTSIRLAQPRRGRKRLRLRGGLRRHHVVLVAPQLDAGGDFLVSQLKSPGGSAHRCVPGAVAVASGCEQNADGHGVGLLIS